MSFKYTGKIVKIVDGDTIDCLLDLGFHIQIKVRFRINNYDAPERSDERGFAAKGYAILNFFNSQCRVTSYKTDKYGRWLADVELADGRDFARTMIDAGFMK